jgi:hypothetical protein
MTLIFQIVAVVAIVVAGVALFRGGGARLQAMRRVFLLLFVVGAASSVFFPQVWTLAANLLGIGRGADLLVYLLVLTFVGFVASTYRRFRQQERDITTLARALALLSARPTASDPDQADGFR